ncbi:MAG TPA: ABC transporter permease [Rhodothermales bacterium]|nr:ABC transporter permease [Rhodothermales bacterium]
MLEKVYYNFAIAAEAIGYNKTRALLTSLGIIFGVASVIAMLAIGNGAQQEILQQIRFLGADNIIITPVVKQEEGQVEDQSTSAQEEKQPFTPGLTLADARSIATVIPGVKAVSPEVVIETTAIRAGLRRSTKLVGVNAAYFQAADTKLASGNYFTPEQLRTSAPVCIIGQKVRSRFFAREEAVGRRIKCGHLWLTVVGVMRERSAAGKTLEHLGIRDYNLDIYAPINTVLLRFEDRSRLTKQDLRRDRNDDQNAGDDDMNYNQVDRLVVRADASRLVKPIADVTSRMLQRRHNGVVDYQVTIPEVLLQQEQRTQRIFNIVLGSIASISLIVGGIGIMNIMLASVMERIKEIGVRRSLGATRRDVSLQFLIEAVTISFTGGVIGIILGVAISFGIAKATDIETAVSPESIALAFLVSVTVGLVFGLLPAKRAAEHDPVVALRYE